MIGAVPRKVVVGAIVLLVGVIALSILVWRPEPRVFRETDSFRQRFHEGLVHLSNERAGAEGGIGDEGGITFEEIDHVTGVASVSRRDWIWTLPSSLLPVSDLSGFATAVMSGWSVPATYPQVGRGGGGARYDLSFGDSQSFGGILITAFEKDGRTTIHSQTMEMAVPPPSASNDSSSGVSPPGSIEELDRFRKLFTAKLEKACEPYSAPSRNRRERGRYSFDRPGDGFSGKSIKEQQWRWVVPSAALASDGLRAFADEVRADWHPEFAQPLGNTYCYSISFGDGVRHAFVNIMAVPVVRDQSGRSRETVIYYCQLLYDGSHPVRAQLRDSMEKSDDLDTETLAEIPGSSERERLDDAKLDGDGFE
jgi:hypothetical protein